MGLFNILLGIIILFFVVLITKQFFSKALKEKTCAICVAVAITWVFLLVLFYLDKFENTLIIALLMGMTLLGIFYIFERNVKKELTLFRLPFLLTLIVVGYFLLTFENLIKELVLLAVIWFVFLLIYGYRNSACLKKFVDKIVECCKKW
jgi:hypothetical protein